MLLDPGYFSKAAAHAAQEIEFEKIASDSFQKFASWVHEEPVRYQDPDVRFLYDNPQLYKQAVLPWLARMLGKGRAGLGAMGGALSSWWKKPGMISKGVKAVQEGASDLMGRTGNAYRAAAAGVPEEVLTVGARRGLPGGKPNLPSLSPGAARLRRSRIDAGVESLAGPGGGMAAMEQRAGQQLAGVKHGPDVLPGPARQAMTGVEEIEAKRRGRRGSTGSAGRAPKPMPTIPGEEVAGAIPRGGRGERPSRGHRGQTSAADAAGMNYRADIHGTSQTAGAAAPAVAGAAAPGAGVRGQQPRKGSRGKGPKGSTPLSNAAESTIKPGDLSKAPFWDSKVPFSNMSPQMIKDYARNLAPNDPLKALLLGGGVGLGLGLLEDDAVL